MAELDEAIKHAEETAKTRTDLCAECRAEHKQLADWLKELREYRKADVVPKSDVEHYIKIMFEAELNKAKQEVASKIIREIRSAIFAHGTKYAMKELAKIEKEHIGKDINVLSNTNEVTENE